MPKITIDTALCVGCTWCAILCPEGVLDIHNEVVAVVVEEHKCTGCKICEEKCPEEAIIVETQKQ